jgi:tetratricopeptide (TPR) repeat protein
MKKVTYYQTSASQLEKKGEKEKARKVYEEALRKHPGNDILLLNFGALLEEMKDWEEAEKRYRELIRRNPRDFYGHYLLGRVLNKRGKHLESIDHLRRSLRLVDTELKRRPGSISEELVEEIKKELENSERAAGDTQMVGDGDYKKMTTEELVQTLIEQCLNVPYILARELSKRTDGAPQLLRLIEKQEYWEHEGPGDAWAPIHALHILGAMGSTVFLEDLVRLLKERADYMGDWLTEDVPYILANFGPEAVKTLKHLVLDEDADVFLRISTARALCIIAKKHEDSRPDVVKFLGNLVASAEEKDVELVSFTIGDLAQFKDPKALQHIKDAFRRQMVDPSIIDMYYIEETYNNPAKEIKYHKDAKDPLQHFSAKNLKHLWKINYG